MCGSPPGTRCPTDTRDACRVVTAEYRDAHPHGGEVGPWDEAGQAQRDLANFNPKDLALLSKSYSGVREAETALADAHSATAAARDDYAAAAAPHEAARADAERRMLAAKSNFHAATREALVAQDAAMQETLRLYEDAGLYSHGMSREIEREHGISYVEQSERWWAGADTTIGDTPPAPFAEDVARYPALANAVKNDAAFKAAQARAAAAATEAHAAERSFESDSDAYRATSDRADAAVANARHATRAAQEQVKAAELRMSEARTEDSFVHAQIDAGISADAERKPLSGVRADDIKVNPDGTTNAWVYRRPTEEQPHGSYTRVVGVVGDDLRSLVTEDGHSIAAVTLERYSGARSTAERHDFTIAIAPAAEGAAPAIASTGRPFPFHSVRNA